MKRLIVEPHADDAALSLAAHIATWVAAGDDVVIVTVYGNDERLAEADAYAAAVGATSVGLGHPEAETGPGLGAGDLAALDADAIAQAVNLCGPDVTYWPLGIGHPEHDAVARLAPSAAARYADKPYWYKTYLADAFSDALSGAVIDSARLASRAHYRRALGAFKTQARFFYFNPPSTLAGPELIVRFP